MTSDEKIAAGQAIYTPMTLAFYDWFVLGFSNRFLWRCPTKHLEALYDRNVSGRHLDIGVGTGYHLEHTKWPVADPKVTLCDLNRHSLNAAATRIAQLAPETIVANALEPLPIKARFSSVGLCYLLHCLPGVMAEKAVLFDNLLPLLSPDAMVFGATIVQGDAPHSVAGRMLMKAYNRKGIFSNTHDTQASLEHELERRFGHVKVWRKGTVALFEARPG